MFLVSSGVPNWLTMSNELARFLIAPVAVPKAVVLAPVAYRTPRRDSALALPNLVLLMPVARP